VGIDDVLAASRAGVPRLSPAELRAAIARGALVVDTRTESHRRAQGEFPGALVIDRTVLEWRLDPTSPHRLPEATPGRRVVVVCDEGYASSLAAATLQQLGHPDATDLAGGFQAMLELHNRAGD
jgi:rhodanese-related sulfurtransferase